MLISLLIGMILGFLAGLGIGGGSLLILWLTLVEGASYPEARWINLAFFLTAAGSVSLIRRKGKQPEMKKLLPAIIAGSITAALFAYFRHLIELEVLKKGFGLLLLATGIREVFYRPRNAR